MKNNCKTGNERYVSRFYRNGQLITEKTAAESSLRFFYENLLGRFLRRLFRMPWWSKLIGWYQDSKLSKRAIKKFVEEHTIDMHEFERPANQYRSFNDFFTRKINPHARPIDQREDVIVSPADAKLLVFPVITESMKFFVKTLPFNLETFLQSKQLASAYNHGTMMIFRLAPYDYHRYHFPTSGNVTKAHYIKGQFESVNPLVYSTGVQPLTGNSRYIISLDTTHFDKVLMIPVGAMCAGKMVNTYQPDQHHKKGEEAGYFAFGGSTVVLLFKQGVVKALDPFLAHSAQGFETAVKMGEAVAKKIS